LRFLRRERVLTLLKAPAERATDVPLWREQTSIEQSTDGPMSWRRQIESFWTAERVIGFQKIVGGCGIVSM
jgi:hypothetical protein